MFFEPEYRLPSPNVAVKWPLPGSVVDSATLPVMTK